MKNAAIRITSFLGFLVAIACFACSPSFEGHLLAEMGSAKVTFDLYHNRVYLPVTVNGREAIHMVLDTGAGMSGVSQTTAQALLLDSSGSAKLRGNGDQLLTVRFAKDVTFRVGDAELIEKSVVLVPFEQMEMYEGRRIQGVLGVDLFNRFVVTIDYAARSLNLSNPNVFEYHGNGTIIPLQGTLNLGKTALFSAAILPPAGRPITVKLAVDLGTYTALRLYTPFSEKKWATACC